MPNLSDYLLPDGRYYLDNAATTRMSSKALRVYNETAERWFMNPMSFKDFDPEIENLLLSARNHVAEFVGGDPYDDKVIFTSGATESINILLKGYFFANSGQKRKIITSRIEHKAVLETCNYLESIGAELVFVNVTSEGVIDYDHLERIVDRDTLFVCLMHVNNETGEISDIERIYDITSAANSKLFTDTTQSITKIKLDSKCFDACVGSAHKFHGPKGVGFLYLKSNPQLSIVQHGGKQEFTVRAGTHNLPGISSMMAAMEQRYSEDYTRIWNTLESSVVRKKCLIGVNRIPNIRAYSIDDLHVFLREFSKRYVFSTGSACNGGLYEKSYVYKVLNQDKPIIRLSL